MYTRSVMAHKSITRSLNTVNHSGYCQIFLLRSRDRINAKFQLKNLCYYNNSLNEIKRLLFIPWNEKEIADVKSHQGKKDC